MGAFCGKEKFDAVSTYVTLPSQKHIDTSTNTNTNTNTIQIQYKINIHYQIATMQKKN